MRKTWVFALAIILLLSCMSMNSRDTDASPAANLIINEIMFDPEGNEVDGEWVELYNTGTNTFNINNWTLSDSDGDVDLVFPDIDVPPGAYILVHAGQGTNSSTFVAGKAEFYMWRSSYIFPSTGDDVLLANETGVTADFVSYGQWNGSQVDPPPGDFPYTHSNATAEEGYSIALLNGQFRQSVPTPLEDNREDVYSGVLITEVLYAPYGECEFFRIANPTASAQDISFWILTDGEGVIAFPSGTTLSEGESIFVAQNATNYYTETVRLPEFEYDSETVAADMLVIGTAPALSNDGDEVYLKNNWGTIIDVFCYGDSAYLGTGWTSGSAEKLGQGHVAKRVYEPEFVDTNTSKDWDNIREYGMAQSAFEPGAIPVVGGIALFTSPDSSFRCLVDALSLAQMSILINVYEFTNTALLAPVLSALGRGVDVKVFLEGSPVGGVNKTELYIAREIVEAGGEVRFIVNDVDGGIYQRYVYNHAKYLVIDNQTLCIMSENWGRTGIPETGKWGNRGWGARIDNSVVARYFAEVFYDDWKPLMKDSVPFDSAHERWDDGLDCTGNYYNTTRVFEMAWVDTPATVTPVLAPDTALFNTTILGMLANAQERVCVEQFYIYKHWGDKTTGSVDATPNLYLEAVIDAARRGCAVRILLDSTDYNVEVDNPLDNDDTIAYVNGIASAENLDMEAKLVNLGEHEYAKIHNKGMIADDSVLISSINWNLNSVTMNRETGVIIENEDVAEYFMEVFEHDWTDDLTSPEAFFDVAPSYLINETVEFNATDSTDNVGIVNYTWHLDGTVASHDIIWNRTFNRTANHTVELVVTDAWGNSGNMTEAFAVLPLPINPADNTTDNETENGTENGDTDGGYDNVTPKLMAILLLVPIAIFIALLYIVKVRER